MKIEFEILGLPKSLNGAHGHWRAAAAERKKWRQLSADHAWAAIARARLAGMEPLKKAKITCTRCSAMRMDFDNLVASFKGCVDGLKDAGLIADDTDEVIVERKYAWDKAKQNEGKIRIIIEKMGE